MRSSHRKAVVVCASLLVFAACGDDDADGEASGSTAASTTAGAVESTDAATPATDGAQTTVAPAPEPVEPLTVIAPSANPTIVGTVGVAVAAGIFEELGLDVDLQAGGNDLNLVVAGSADLTQAATADAGSLEAQGKGMSAIWAASGGGLGAVFLVAADGPESIEEFTQEAADGCSFGITSIGSTSYSYGNALNAALDVDCELLELGSSTSQIVGAVVSGRADMMVGTPGNPSVAAAIEAGELKVLIDTADRGDPLVDELGIGEITDRVWIGLEDNLESKRESIVRFVAGLKTAAEMFETAPAEELADLLLTLDLMKDEYPAAEDREDLIAAIEAAKPYTNWNDGYITKEDWEQGLASIATWGLDDFDPADPARSYERIVDMSFYDEAVV